MRYIGTKTLVLPQLGAIVKRNAPKALSLCDPFAGTCSVSRYFKAQGLKVTTGDVMAFSHEFQLALVGLNSEPRFSRLVAARELIEDKQPRYLRVLRRLNELTGTTGYITTHFSKGKTSTRQFFSRTNAQKIDAVRTQIETWQMAGLLTRNELAYLRTAMIDAADKVANTAGTYYAYLKTLDRKALKTFVLIPPSISRNGFVNECFLEDARSVAAASNTDILYLDPPYNERDYSSYYHLPETLARGTAPTPRGLSGVPWERTQPKSDFCRPSTASNAFRSLIHGAKSRYILVHYATDGLITHDEIMDTLTVVGKTTIEDLVVRAYATTSAAAKSKASHRIYWCDRGLTARC